MLCFTINFGEVKGLIICDSYYYGTPQKSASRYTFALAIVVL